MAKKTTGGSGGLPASLNENGSLPTERFSSAGEVNELCQQMILADEPRAKNRAIVQGVIDGNRPYNQGVLMQNGQGWRGNVNYREAEGMIQAQRNPYYDLVTEVSPCVEIELDYGSPAQRAEWQHIIARHFHKMLFKWGSFDWHTQLCQSEMLVHGWGAHLRLSKKDWRPTTKTMRHILFPDRTTSDLENLEFFVVREPQLAHQLYGKIANESAARRAGWKPAAVKAAISRATLLEPRGGQRASAEDVQSRLKNGDMGYGRTRSREIWVNHVFVAEFTGQISHYIIEEGQSSDYLFVSRNRFKNMAEIISLFPYDIGTDGTIHSIRGLGTRIFPFMELSNRLKNHMVDSVMVGSGVLLTSKNNIDPARLALTSVGPMKLLPPGIEPSNYKVMDLAQGPLALSRELQDTMSENTKSYRQTASDSSSRERTAFEVSVNAQDSAKLQKSSHNMFYRSLEKHYDWTLRRAANPNYRDTDPGGEEAVKFQRRCLRDGVPQEALQQIVSVTATRSIGAGSAGGRISVARALMETVYPSTTSEAARNAMMRDYVAAFAGHAAVDRYVPNITTTQIPNNDDAIAVIENDILLSGGEAIVTDGQDHARHAMRHLGKAAQLLGALQQGQMQPGAVMSAWNGMGPHIAAHLVFIQRDPTRKAQFAQLNENFTAMSGMADKLLQHLSQQQAAQDDRQLEQSISGASPGDGMASTGDPELDLKMKSLMADFQIKMTKIAGELQIKQKLADAKIESERQKQSLPYKRGSGNTEPK